MHKNEILYVIFKFYEIFFAKLLDFLKKLIYNNPVR